MRLHLSICFFACHHIPLCVTTVWFFTLVKSPSSIWFVDVWWRACLKGFWVCGGALRFQQEKTSNVLFLERSVSTTWGLKFSPNIFLSRFFGLLLRFLIFVNFDYTKSSSTLGLVEVLFNLSHKIFCWNFFYGCILV